MIVHGIRRMRDVQYFYMRGQMKKIDKEVKGLGVSRELIERAAEVLNETPQNLISKIKETYPVAEEGRVSFFEGLQRNMTIQEEIDAAMKENLSNMVGYCKLEGLDIIMTVEGFANAGFLIAARGKPTPFAIQKSRYFIRFFGDDPKERPEKDGGKTPLIKLCNANNCTATAVRKAAEKAARSCHTDMWTRVDSFPLRVDQNPSDPTVLLLLKHCFATFDVKANDGKHT